MSNKKLFLVLIVVCGMVPAMAGGAEPCVVNSAGNSLMMSGVTIDYAVGEICIASLASSSNYVTQGFLQPATKQVVTSIVRSTEQNEIAVYPNPTYGLLCFNANTTVFQANVYTMQGLKVCSFERPQKSLELSQLAKGVYFVELIGENQVKLANAKIIKQ